MRAASTGPAQRRACGQHCREHIRADAVVAPRRLAGPAGPGVRHHPGGDLLELRQDAQRRAGRFLPARLITDVTVSPAHRRRGLLRQPDHRGPRRTRSTGVCRWRPSPPPRGSIYGTLRLRSRPPSGTPSRSTPAPASRCATSTDPAPVELVEPLGGMARDQPSSSPVPPADPRLGRAPRVLRPSSPAPSAARTGGPTRSCGRPCTSTPPARPDGYALYRPVDQRRTAGRAIDVTDLRPLTPAGLPAPLALPGRPRPLPTGPVAPRPGRRPAGVGARSTRSAVRVTAASTDPLWVRVLDVLPALEARPWGRDGEVGAEVADPLGHAAGRYRCHHLGSARRRWSAHRRGARGAARGRHPRVALPR